MVGGNWSNYCVYSLIPASVPTQLCKPTMPRTRSGRETSRSHRMTQEERNYADHIERIRVKSVISSPIIDLSVVDQLGINEDFNVLTRRVGLGQRFWYIARDHVAFTELTHDFLASVTLYEPEDDEPYISFLMMGEYYEVYLSVMRGWFGFPEPETEYIGYGPETEEGEHLPTGRADFWYRITGQELGASATNDLRVNMIIHPSLRFLCRTLSFTVFARGESSLRPTHDDLRLLATMLRHRRDGFKRPDLMMLMVRHWISIRAHGRTTGQITCGSYITCIASYLQVDIETRHRIAPPITVDLGKLSAYQWLTITPTPEGPRLTWRTSRGSFTLPLSHSLDPYNDRSWRMEEYVSDEATPTFIHVQVPAAAYASPSHVFHHAGPSHTYFPDPDEHPQSMPGEFGWPQMHIMLTDIRTDQRAHHQTLLEVQNQGRTTHRTLLDMRTDQRAYSYSLHELTTRVADLELGAAAREERHERRRRRRGPADPSTSQG